MRWIWLDKIVELTKAERMVAIKNVTAAEDVLHDHFAAAAGGGRAEQGYHGGPTGAGPDAAHPAYPVMPNSLIIEGFAQTAGILVGHAKDFKEKVILAKIGKASFTGVNAVPGTTVRYTAELRHLDDRGASTRGSVDLLDPLTGKSQPLAEIEMMFSHIDQNMKGIAFPEHNFVFTDQFMDLLKRSGID
ncbi:MAG: beta-hydroxyacyl-ACP dehydratase [Planctomycetota bacterium]